MAKDPYRYFRIEAAELLEQLAKSALDLEKSGAGAEPVLRLLRLAHTLKGAARVVRQAGIADLAHGVEDLLSPHRDGKQAVPREGVDRILGALDAMAYKLAQLPLAENAEVQSAMPNAKMTKTETAIRIVRADAEEVDTVLEGLGEIGNELENVRRAAASVEKISELGRQLFRKNSLEEANARSIAEEIRELAIAAERNLKTGIERLDRELGEARDAAERLRLVPATGIFQALERTARDAAYGAGKQVEFEAKGDDIRIDGEVLDTVQNALIQLVRNAVAHGIEPHEQRHAAGKPPAGRVTVEMARHGYHAWFRCRDDGAGVDIEAVRRAVQKRDATVSNADAQEMDKEELLALLLKGGITTTGVVTGLSGRGVGLDLVREAMQRLNGEVVAHTAPGSGTTIELRVPLTLAALQVLMVENDAEVAALPLDAVRRALRIAPEDIVHTSEGAAIVYEGKQIALLPLRLGNTRKIPRTSTASALRAVTAVVVASAGSVTAIAVERLKGIERVVLRPLPTLTPVDPIVLGLHLNNEGNPRIVLDPEQLVNRQRPDLSRQALQKLPQKALHPILIIDDSLTTRMLESSILESAGYAVELAACAEEGLDMARRNAYALFLVDVEMPGMDGFGFAECTRADPVLRNIPCILVTSRNAPEDRRRGAESGADAYIVKGEFDQVKFLERVTELVRQ